MVKQGAFQGDTQQFNSLTISQGGTADYEGAVIHNVGAGIVPTDAANVGQVLEFISLGTSTQISTLLGDIETLSTFTNSSITTINTQLVTISGQISSLQSTVSNSTPSNWAEYAANSTVNFAGNNVFSTLNQTFINGAQSFNLNWTTLSNISTQAAAGAAGSPAVWAQFAALNDVNMAASSLLSTLGVTFINTGLTSTATFGFNDYYYFSTNISSLVASSGADISTLSTSVASNTDNISSLSSFVNTLSTVNGSNLSTLSNSFSTTSNAFVDLSSLTNTIYGLTSSTSTTLNVVYGLASTNSTALTTLTGTVDTVYGLASTNSTNFSTLSNYFSTTSNALSRKFVGAIEITPGSTATGLIVSTNISTLGYLNVFQNTSSTSLILELNLSTLALWPNTANELMRFAHYGQPGTQSSVLVYTEDSNYAGGLLAEMAAGDTISFIYKGGDPLVDNNRISTTQYYRVTGY